MRAIGAGLFVFISTLLLVGLLSSWRIFDQAPSPIIGIGITAFMLAMMTLSLWLFNPKGSDPFNRKTTEQRIQHLEQLGLLESTSFCATRAFGVEEFEDEGVHYFIELTDGSVLFLSGQYLYDYEPIVDDPETNQPRSFPCTKFVVQRHKKERYVIRILPDGDVLEPEIMAPSFGRKVWQTKGLPEDGQLITSTTYDDLARQLTSKGLAADYIDSSQKKLLR